MNARPNMLPANGYRTMNPNSVMIVDAVPMPPPSSAMMMVEPNNMTYEMMNPPTISSSGSTSSAGVMPTVTMTISSASAPNPVSVPSIELNTNMNMAPIMMMANTSKPIRAALIQQPAKNINCNHQHQHQLRYVEPLEQYEWESRSKVVSRQPAPISPANRYRSERIQLKGGQQQILRHQPIVRINHNWGQMPARVVTPVAKAPLIQQEQFEQEQWVPAGPPQLIPVYQSSNGGLHLSPPTTMLPEDTMRSFDSGTSFESESSFSSSRPDDDPNREVHLIGSSSDASNRFKMVSTESSSLGGSTTSSHPRAEQRSSLGLKPTLASGLLQKQNSFS